MRERCEQTTAAGGRCRRPAAAGADRCAQHLRSVAARRAEQPTRRGPGRPPSLTEDRIAVLERLLEAGNALCVARQAAGVPRSTFMDWMHRGSGGDPDTDAYAAFAQRIERALAVGETRNVQVIADAGPSDWRAAAWLLEHRAPERWAKPSQRAHATAAQTSPDDGTDPGDAGPLGVLLAQVRASQLPRGQG